LYCLGDSKKESAHISLQMHVFVFVFSIFSSQDGEFEDLELMDMEGQLYSFSVINFLHRFIAACGKDKLKRKGKFF
jgi:hypothetical protein